MSLIKRKPLLALPILALVASACGTSTASSSPSQAATAAASPSASASANASASASSAASPSASGSAAAKDFSGVTVNVITFTGPPIAEPLQRHALEWQQMTGGKVNITTAPFSDLFQKEADGPVHGHQCLHDLHDVVVLAGQLRGPGLLPGPQQRGPDLPGTPVGRRRAGHAVELVVRRQDLRDPHRQRRPVGLLPHGHPGCRRHRRRPRRGTSTSRSPRSTRARTSTVTACPTTGRASRRPRVASGPGSSTASSRASSRPWEPSRARSSATT